MEENDFLLKEHEELIQLFIHEDSLAWNLIYFYIVLNVGLLSLIGALSKSLTSEVTVISIILCFFGGIFGII